MLVCTSTNLCSGKPMSTKKERKRKHFDCLADLADLQDSLIVTSPQPSLPSNCQCASQAPRVWVNKHSTYHLHVSMFPSNPRRGYSPEHVLRTSFETNDKVGVSRCDNSALPVTHSTRLDGRHRQSEGREIGASQMVATCPEVLRIHNCGRLEIRLKI